MSTAGSRVDAAWDLWEAGRSEELLQLIAGWERDGIQEPEATAFAALAYLDQGDARAAERELKSAVRVLEPADPLLLLARGEVALARWQIEAAAEAFETLLAQHDSADTRLRLSLCADILDRGDDAAAHVAAARELDPERLSGLGRYDVEHFESVVHDAARRLPPEFRALLDEIAVVIDPVPGQSLARGVESETPPDALGLFVGASALERSIEGVELPPTIYVFQRNLERICNSREELEEEIHVTLYHELGHALGFDEEGVDDLGLA